MYVLIHTYSECNSQLVIVVQISFGEFYKVIQLYVETFIWSGG